MVYTLALLSALIAAIIKQPKVFYIYLLSLVYACVYYFTVKGKILFDVEIPTFLVFVVDLFPLLIIFLAALCIRRKK